MAQVHHAIRAIKTGDHNLAALSKSHLNYKASFLVRKESALLAEHADQRQGLRA